MNEIEVPKGWLTEPLKNMCDFFVPMRDKPTEFDGKVPWLRIDEISQKFTDGSKAKHRVSEKTIQDMKLRVYPIGTVLCSCSATLGVCTITKAKLTTNQTFIGIFPKTTIFNEYLYYYLKAKITDLTKLGKGTTISYISRQKFENFHIVYPANIEDQKKIVRKLDHVLDYIEEKKKEIFLHINRFSVKKINENYRHHILKLAFDGTLTNEKITNSKMDEPQIPKKWKIVTLADIILETKLGANFNRSQQSTSNSTPYLKMNNITKYGTLSLNNITFVNATKKEIEEFRLHCNDLLFNTRNSLELVGKTTIWDNSLENCIFNLNIMRIRFQKDIVPKFVNYFMLSNYFQNPMKQFKQQTTNVCAIYARDLFAQKIYLPPIETQKQIVQILDKKFDDWEKQIIQIKDIEQNHQLIKDHFNYLSSSILDVAFSGKLVN